MDESDRLWQMRRHALNIGDPNLAAEIALQMERLGIPIERTPLDDTPAMKERAVSHKTPSKRQR